MHSNGRLGNLLERNGFYMLRPAQGISDVQVCDTGNGYDGTNGSRFYFYFIQTVKLIQLADLDTFLFVRLVMIYQNAFLVYLDDTVVYFTNADTSNILIVINGADQYLGSSGLISGRSRDVV